MNRLCRWLFAAVSVILSFDARAATCGSGATDANAVVMAQHAAYVAHGVDAFGTCYADDVVIIDLTSKRPPIVGSAALREVYGTLFKRVPADLRSEYLGKLINGQSWL